MLTAEQKRDYFWKIFEEVLVENGKPFKIMPHKGRQWAWVEERILLEFLVQKGIFRVGLYLSDEQFYHFLVSRKGEIEKMLGFSPTWTSGERSGNVKRIKTEFAFDGQKCDESEYRNLIDVALPTIVSYIKAFKPYF